MADKKDLKPRDKLALSRADHGKLMAQALIEGMVQNPDTVLRTQGHGNLFVYKELLRDDQVKSAFQQRRTAVVKSPWEVEPASESPQDVEIAEFVRRALGKMRFDDLTDKMMYGIHYGYAVAEKIWYYDEDERQLMLDLKVRDRARFGFDVDNQLMLIHPDGKRELMPQDKFWVFSAGADHDDNPYGEGLAHALYWPVFFKRNGIKFWLIYLEKYGMPTAAAKLSTAQMKDPEKRSLALDVLDAIHADSGVVVPEDFAIELIEASRSGTADYQSIKEAMDASIAKIVLSQTMTTDNGSSRSQAEVHETVRDHITTSDADMICDSFTKQVIDDLVRRNFGKVAMPKVWRRTEPEKDLGDIAERDKKVMDLGFEPSEEYIQETYGSHWTRKQQQEALELPQEQNTEFSEQIDIEAKKIAHRRDQDALMKGAKHLAEQYQVLIAPELDQILAFAEETGDLQTLRDRLDELFENPRSEKVDKIMNSTLIARLAGRLAKQ